MYIDPNTGGIVFQILAALLGAASGAILLFSGKIRKIFAKLRRQARERTESDPEKQLTDDQPQPPTS
jgi:hypothetical protein